jgi:glycerate 2-kinase
MPDLKRSWVFLSGGTDGRDGPTEAAGGIVDAGTLARIAASGGDPATLLRDNDSNKALAMAGDLLVTGATGTNVADVQILLLAV